MALSKGSKVEWSDMTAILSSVNSARSHFGEAQKTITGGVGTPAYAEQALTAWNGLMDLNGKQGRIVRQAGFIRTDTVALTLDANDAPFKGTLIKLTPMAKVKSEAERIVSQCFPTFCTDCFTFNFGQFSFGACFTCPFCGSDCFSCSFGCDGCSFSCFSPGCNYSKPCSFNPCFSCSFCTCQNFHFDCGSQKFSQGSQGGFHFSFSFIRADRGTKW